MTTQPTETLTLAAFLSARLDDDADWTAKAADFDSASWSVRGKGGWAVASNTINARDVPGSMTCSTAPHIARHDPARVLAEVEAKRRIVALHGEATITYQDDSQYQHCRRCVSPDDWCASLIPEDERYPCETLRLLALPYAGHESYDESWRV